MTCETGGCKYWFRKYEEAERTLETEKNKREVAEQDRDRLASECMEVSNCRDELSKEIRVRTEERNAARKDVGLLLAALGCTDEFDVAATGIAEAERLRSNRGIGDGDIVAALEERDALKKRLAEAEKATEDYRRDAEYWIERYDTTNARLAESEQKGIEMALAAKGTAEKLAASEAQAAAMLAELQAARKVVEAADATVRRMDSPPFWPEPGEIDDQRAALFDYRAATGKEKSE
jgi:hypothetical protein